MFTNINNNLFSPFGMFGTNCFGGNMFGCNSFGSVFSNMGFGGFGGFGGYSPCCNSGMNGTSFFGLMLGTFAPLIGLGIANKVASHKQANSAQSVKGDINQINREIKAECAKLGPNVTEKNYANYTAKSEEWYTRAKTKNDKAIADALKVLEQYPQSKLNELETAYINAENALKNNEDENLTNDLVAKKNEAQKAYETAKNEVEKAEKDKLEAEIMNKELDQKAEIEDAKYDSIKEKIASLIKEKNNALSIYNQKVNAQTLDDADGSWLNRTSAKVLENKNSNYSKSDIRGIVHEFRTATETETKAKWAQKLVGIEDDALDATQRQAKKIAQKWLEKYSAE